MNTHRVRRLRWQAGAATPAEAFALRTLLHEQADACQAALERAFDQVAPVDEVWHLPRLVLTVRLADLQNRGAGLAERVEAALRAALAGADRRDDEAVNGADDAVEPRASAAASSQFEASRQSVAFDARQALHHYLASGLLPWTLAGLAPEQAQQHLSEAAVNAAEALLFGADTLDALPPPGTDARIGALLRWLPLLPPALRRRWLGASRAPQWLPDPAVIEAWRAWADHDAGERTEWQAVWLAGPFEPAVLHARIVAQRSFAGNPEPPFVAALRAALAGASGAPAALQRVGRAALEPGQPESDPVVVARAAGTAVPMRGSADVPDAAPESLLVPLAGLVLLHPWLPRLLEGCGVLEAGARRIEPAALPRACALLHALACGDSAPAEHQLPFVKLLLGRAPDEPLSAALAALTPDDHAEIAALLDAVREHWSALRGTAVDGLRLSFLQRRGLLAHGDGAWTLRMQSESFDMLLGLLPWSIALVRLPWMREPLVVEWPTP